MPLIEIDRRPAATTLRWFGVLLAAFIVLAGGLVRWGLEAPAVAGAIWTAGALFAGIYAAVPPLRRWIYVGWLCAAFPVSWTLSHLLLAMVYYLVVTPIGLLLRLVKGNPLDRAPDRAAATYWIARRPTGDVRRYFRQF